MCEKRVSVALLQEPFVRCNKICGLPTGVTSFLAVGGKAAVIVRDTKIESMLVNDCTDDRGVCVWIKGAFGELYVMSVYCRYGSPIEPYITYMEGVLQKFNGRPVMIGMDSNAVSPLWFSKIRRRANIESIERGWLLEEMVLDRGLVVINQPSRYYTFSTLRSKSDIDVTLVSQCVTERYECTWEVLDNCGLSDHSVIVIGIRLVGVMEDTGNRFVVPRWSLKDVDWVRYIDLLKTKITELPLTEFNNLGIDEQISLLNDCVISSNNECMRKKVIRNSNKIAWWTNEIRMKRREVRRMLKVYKRLKNQTDADIQVLTSSRRLYRSTVNAYKNLIRKTKLENWRAFVAERSDDPWGKVYKICRSKLDRHSLSSLTDGDTRTTNWIESANMLLEKFFPEGSVNENVERNEEGCIPVTRDEVETAITMLKSKKSPGLDGVVGEMAKKLWIAVPEYLECMYNKCIQMCYFPNEWKRANVVILLKGSDKDKTNPGSYRPISLLPVFGKALERILINRLSAETDAIISEFQFGFRKGRSVEDAWAYVKSCVNDSLNKYVLGVFIDFRGAFDHLNWDCIIQKLRETGCKELGIWHSYFTNRKACVIGKVDSVWRVVKRGCPQGSICGPYMWNLVMNDLLNELANSGCKLCAYADDLLLLVEGNSRSELERKSARYLNVVTNWSEGVGVEVSKDKTVCMLMRGKLNTVRRALSVRTNGSIIKYVSSTKYLGINVGERMNFKTHLNVLRDKMVTAVSGMSRVLRVEWGLGRKAMLVIYKSLFVACVAFGASIWYDILRFGYARDEINRCQRVAMVACLKVCRTVPTVTMQVLLGVPPLDLEIVRMVTNQKIRKGTRLSLGDLLTNNEIVGRSLGELKQLSFDRTMGRWQARWNTSEKGRITFRFIENVNFARLSPRFNPSLQLNYILTGHGSLNDFLHRRGLSESSNCACGAVNEDWKHVLIECRLYDEFRNLNEMNIHMSADGEYEYSGVLTALESYESIAEFANKVFEKRKTIVTELARVLVN